LTRSEAERVLVVGGGGREHALIKALARSARAPELLCAPGNAGIAEDARVLNVAADDVDGLLDLSLHEQVDLVVVGPEVPLVAGLANVLTDAGVRCFGPSEAAAQLEGSKAFCKEVMAAAGIPTAAYETVTTVKDGLAAITGYPTVIKADGLAAGKGVIIATDELEAKAALAVLLVEHKFGTERVIVEEFLAGEELSLLALCDGETALPLATAQDYKRIHDGNKGPNTGGMGSYSPVPAIGADRAKELAAQVHQPVLEELNRRGAPFHGVLYAGLMMTADGPRVLEFNVRFGDPETQAILPRLESDLLDLLIASTERGGLADARLSWTDRTAVTVVLASAGYPESSSSGDVITGLDAVDKSVEIAHAGTALDANGRVVTAGGRVLNVTALGTDAADARAAAYAAADMIEFTGKQMRRDIAFGVA
jgi:phosphoribosylamine--glycine ligase